jgi:hypothetical protein
MRTRRSLGITLLAAAVLTAFGCAERVDAPPFSVLELASAWSGGRAEPICSNRGPRGEYLGTTPGAQLCRWPELTRGTEFSSVTATRDSVLGWSSIQWERITRDSATAAGVLDSLDRVFTRAGFRTVPCPFGARQWRTEGMVVQTMPIMPRPTGRMSLSIWVVPSPAAIPSLICPPITSPQASGA